MDDAKTSHSSHGSLWSGGVVIAAAVIAIGSARPYAGSWNDGSRLATVECLVDYRTLAIDDSIFVRVPPHEIGKPGPYPENEPGLHKYGTGDKLLIHGRFYSDKSPVPALLMAGVYQTLQWCTGLVASRRPDWFCYLMTLTSSGIAYVVSVWCIYLLGGQLNVPRHIRLLVAASSGLSTVALTYCRHVNNHILLLAITSALLLGVLHLRRQVIREQTSLPLLFGLGNLAGLGYATDLGAGPVILLCTTALSAYRCRRPRSLVFLGLGALPWVALHHIVNYAVGGTFKPANAVAEYFQWPGCTFTPQNMTGAWNHKSTGHFIEYAVALLVGKRGFLGHNLPLFLVLPGMMILVRRRLPELPELLHACACAAGVWLAYALTSNNYSGMCCGIRWFVPLLAPGYFVLMVLLRDFERLLPVHMILSGWGAALALLMWWSGPWIQHMVPLFWPVQGAAVGSLLIYWQRSRRCSGAPAPGAETAAGHQFRAA